MAKLICPIHQWALSTPEKPALIDAGFTLNYQQTHQRILHIQTQLLRAGLKKGSHLFIDAKNNWQMVLLLWACWREGMIACPVNPAFPAERKKQLQARVHATTQWPNSNLVIDFAIDSQPPQNLTSSFPIELDDTNISNLIFTSGSSGTPKVVAHYLANHLANARGSRVPVQSCDSWLLSLPLFHVGGIAILFRCFLAGASVCLPNSEHSLAEFLSKQPVTHLSLVPTQLYRLLHNAAFHFSNTHVKHLLLGGAPIPDQLVQDCKQQGLFPWVSYGLSEMASQVCTMKAATAGQVGAPLPGRQVIIQQGEICVKGETLFAGYYQDDGSILCPLDDEGWFHTGDAGHWQAQQLVLEGRLDNQFISGGENIQPEQIEQQLIQHPAIVQAIVVPTPDPEWGMKVTCFVDWSETPLSDEEISQWLRQYLPGFMIPKIWRSWPTLESGQLKIQRSVFKALAES